MAIWNDSGFAAFTMGNAIMMLVGIVLLYLALGKGFEPLLLSPIAFGCLLANVPKTGFETDPGGRMQVILYGIHHEVFPPLIFLGVGAITDFGPLIANPKTLLLGAAAQAGVFISLLRCYVPRLYRQKLPLTISSAALTARPQFTLQAKWLRPSCPLPLQLIPTCLRSSDPTAYYEIVSPRGGPRKIVYGSSCAPVTKLWKKNRFPCCLRHRYQPASCLRYAP
jgi:hypothetical protein